MSYPVVYSENGRISHEATLCLAPVCSLGRVVAHVDGSPLSVCLFSRLQPLTRLGEDRRMCLGVVAQCSKAHTYRTTGFAWWGALELRMISTCSFIMRG